MSMRLFGLIGYPLAHSFSEAYFREKFENEEIGNCKYRNFPIKSVEEITSLVKENQDLTGLNVTIPYKQKVLRYLDEIDDTARDIGAVNTIKIARETDSGKFILKGYNTDAHGFMRSLQEIEDHKISKALVLGTGGASLAVIFALNKLGIQVRVVSRNPDHDQLSYDKLAKSGFQDYQLIVNTTPLGTYPNLKQAPELPYELINESHILHDLVYNPPETEFMRRGKRRGAKVKNGYRMLVEQAEKSWQIWND